MKNLLINVNPLTLLYSDTCVPNAEESLNSCSTYQHTYHINAAILGEFLHSVTVLCYLNNMQISNMKPQPLVRGRCLVAYAAKHRPRTW